MARSFWILAVLLLRTAWAQAPDYAATGIVNASNYTYGPFAPNSVLSIFGTNLSWNTYSAASSDIGASGLPVSLAGVSVYVDNWPAPLYYVSPTQINFLIPGNEIAGNVTVCVTREGVSGPLATIALVNAAPALFDLGNGFAIATHANGSLLTDASPAQTNEIVVVYATGLGPTNPNPAPGQIPLTAAILQYANTLSVSLGGTVLQPIFIKYAGLTPESVGLYQINLQIPPGVGTDPAIQVSMGAQSNANSLQLAVQ